MTEATKATGLSNEAESPFSRVFSQYAQSMAALREFFSALNPVALSLDEHVDGRHDWIETVAGLPASAKADLMRLSKDLEAALSSSPPDTRIDLEFRPQHPAAARAFMTLVRRVKERRSMSHGELLNRGVIINIVGFFEVLVADLARVYYTVVPEAMSNDEKTLSINELRSIGSVEEAIRQVVTHKIDDLLRGSLEDWEKFFASRLKIELSTLVRDWHQWCEVFQRRHIFVHAGGLASHRYIDKVNWSEVTWPAVRPQPGDPLPAEDAYVSRAIDLFEVAGLLLCQCVWKKLEKADQGRLNILNSVVYDTMLADAWCVAEHLAAWGARDDTGSESTQLALQVNHWLSVKRQGRWAEIEAEVRAFDCSAKSLTFVLAWLALQDRRDEFFAALPASMVSGITMDELIDWPVLEEMRADPRFAEFVAAELPGPAGIRISVDPSESELTDSELPSRGTRRATARRRPAVRESPPAKNPGTRQRRSAGSDSSAP